MNKGLKAVMISGLTLLVGVACSHSNKQAGPSPEAQLNGVFQKDAPGFNAKDNTIVSTLELSPELSPIPATGNGKIAMSITYKGIVTPVTFVSDTIDYSTLKSGQRIAMTLSSDDQATTTSILGLSLTARLHCLANNSGKNVDCSQVAVLLTETGEYINTNPKTAGFVFQTSPTSGAYVLKLNNSGLQRVASTQGDFTI